MPACSAGRWRRMDAQVGALHGLAADERPVGCNWVGHDSQCAGVMGHACGGVQGTSGRRRGFSGLLIMLM